ncbi:MAG: sigma-70 family RNA polymerase sigma factor [Spirochaetes bacterium]|nr:sigma-70 family RNA polymerase sigma factor [Spirochaetota bacterium]MBN2771863.1 sigma-70 family RNA polymerase sigma factor [Spirochaetota bacterium]
MNINVEEYYVKYGPMVYRRCLAMLKNEDRAADAMQDVFVKILRYKGSLEHKYPSSLLYTIATNICLNIIKADKRVSPAEVEDVLHTIACYNEGESRVIVDEYLDSIFEDEKEGTREIAVMFYIDRMKLQQISDVTGLSVSGIRKRLSKVKQIAASFREDYHEQ